jgi:uncharacterized protein
MRDVPLLTGVIFILFYAFISVAGSIALRSLSPGSRPAIAVIRFYWLCSFVMAFLFIILFIYPFTAKTATFYSIYFYYNSILTADVFTKLPIAISGSFALFMQGKRMAYHIAFAGFMISLGVALSVIWGFTMGSRTLNTKYMVLEFSDLPDSFDGFRITQLSDLHLGNFHYSRMLQRAIRENNHFNPDVVVFTGDLVNNFAGELTGWEKILPGFKAASAKLAVLGNHDYGDYYRWPDLASKTNNFMGILEAYQTFGFHILRNESYLIDKGPDSLYISGVENWGHPPFPQYADLDAAVKDIPEDKFRILLTHDPAHWAAIVRNLDNYPLTFSGHSHGLQWGIKLAGFEFSLIWFSRNNWGGLYNYKSNYLYVNRGLGTIGIPMRLDMPPEITFVTLRKK